MTSITSITRIPRMLGKFGDDMVFACVRAMSVQQQCSQDAAATTAAAARARNGVNNMIFDGYHIISLQY